MDLQKAIQNELAVRRQHIANSFTNSKEILNEVEDLTKAEGEETTEGEGEKEEKEESDDDSEAHGESGETEKAEENVFEVEAENLIKAEEDAENPFIQEAAEIEEIEKSDIYEAVNYTNNIKINKTGKELKEQINTVVLPALNADLQSKESEADTLLAECGTAPTKDCDSYYKREMGIDTPFKEYRWEETRLGGNDNITSASLSYEHSAEKAAKVNVPATEDEAEARRKYNEKVREICGILVDIKTCEILSKVSEKDTFELTPKQITAFKF